MQVFSAFGTVQKIAIFEKSAGFQALVQYPGFVPMISSFKVFSILYISLIIQMSDKVQYIRHLRQLLPRPLKYYSSMKFFYNWKHDSVHLAGLFFWLLGLLKRN